MIKKILDNDSAKYSSDLNEASAINEVKLLMESNAMDDLHLLQNAFPNSTNTNIITANGEREHIKRLNNIHNGNIYTSAEIKNLCMKYRLRFLPANLFKGNVPIELLHELKRKTTEDNKMSHLGNATPLMYERNLYIIAPISMFNVKGYRSKKIADIKEAKRLRKLDPACFIKVEDNKFLFVKEWGNSFSFARRILGASTSTKKSLSFIFFLCWVIYVIVGFKAVSILKSIAFITSSKGEIYGTIWVLPFFLLLVWVILSSVSWICHQNTGFFMSLYKGGSFWEIDENYTTEENWNKS